MTLLTSLTLAGMAAAPMQKSPVVHPAVVAMSLVEVQKDNAKASADRSLFALVGPAREPPRGAWGIWLVARDASFGLSAETPLLPAKPVTVLYPDPGVPSCVGEAVATAVLALPAPDPKRAAPAWSPHGAAWRIQGCPPPGSFYAALVLEGAHPSARMVKPDGVPKQELDRARALSQAPGAPEGEAPWVVSVEGWRLFVFQPSGTQLQKVVALGHGQETVAEGLSF